MRCSPFLFSKKFLNKRDEGGIGKGERDEGDGDEDVHFEIQMRESFVDHFEALIHEFKPFIDELEFF